MLRKVVRPLLTPAFSTLEIVLIGVVFYCVEVGISILTGALLVVCIIALSLLDRFYGPHSNSPDQ